jgi:hypothetical protein
MKGKRAAVMVSAAAVILAGVFFWMSRSGYQIDENASDVQPNSLEGITFAIEGSRRGGHLEIRNDSYNYIVIEFSRRPVEIQILEDDGWHTLETSRIWRTEPGAVTKGTDYTLDFSWREVLGGSLKPGRYRGVLYYGDGKVDHWDFFSSIAEFTVN